MSTTTETRKLPSKYQIGDECGLNFFNSKHLPHSCYIEAVKFSESKIYYDVRIPVGFGDEFTILMGIDSVFISEKLEHNG